MAKTPNGNEGVATEKKARKPQKPRPLIMVVQVLDENGQPMPFAKERLSIVTVTRDPGTLVDFIDGSSVPHAFVRKLTVE